MHKILFFSLFALIACQPQGQKHRANEQLVLAIENSERAFGILEGRFEEGLARVKKVAEIVKDENFEKHNAIFWQLQKEMSGMQHKIEHISNKIRKKASHPKTYELNTDATFDANTPEIKALIKELDTFCHHLHKPFDGIVKQPFQSLGYLLTPDYLQCNTAGKPYAVSGILALRIIQFKLLEYQYRIFSAGFISFGLC